jgi:phenylacetate-CoA ligase
MTTATSNREPRQLPSLIAELAARDHWSKESVRRHQRERLRDLIGFAVANSAYYREALGPDAADRPLEELPTLTKATMMEHFDGLVTDPRLRRAEIDEHLAGPEPGAEVAGEFTLVTTSGTTGARGIFAYSRAEMQLWLAANLRAIARIGARPGMRLIGIGSPSPLFMSRRVFAGVQGAASSRPPDLSVTTPIPEMVEGLNAFQPEVIMGYPSIEALLAEEQLAGRLQISPKVVACGSEVLSDDHARRMEAAWGLHPGNGYVTTEACPIATGRLQEDGGMHVCDDLVVIEVVDEAGDPVPPGVPGHRVLLTNLVNETQPLIRYELTDSVTMAEGPNPTGMPWQQISRVDGRSAEILRLPGRDGDVTVHPHRLRAPFATLDDVLQYQFTYDGEALAVALVLRPDADRGLPERVRSSLATVLQEAGAGGVDVVASAVEEIPREPGGGAKLKQLRLSGAAAARA